MAIQMGADALGLVGPMPSGPGPIDPMRAGAIAGNIPGTIESFYLTSQTKLDAIAAEYVLVRSSHIQLTDHVDAETRKALRKAFPDLKIVQVIHVQDEDSVNLARSSAETSDYLLLDSGAPEKANKELGGTGRIHDWQLSKRIVELSRVPVFLAGGLRSDNIRTATRTVRPFGVDVCSGVRTRGILDQKKLAGFFSEVRLA